MSPVADSDVTLTCQIETQSEYELGKPVLVKGTLHNPGPAAMWVLSWNTFLEPRWQHCLVITHNGAPIPYIGTRASRGAPTKESFTRIPVGESVSAQIDIHAQYLMADPGEYQAWFHLPVLAAFESIDGEWPSDMSRYKPAVIDSTKVTFRMTGQSLVRSDAGMRGARERLDTPKQIVAYPAEAMFPFLRGMNTNYNEAFFEAHRWAYARIVAALQSVETSAETPLYKKWFDRSSVDPERAANRKAVIDALRKMADQMATTMLGYEKVLVNDADCMTDANRQAWVKRGANTVALCHSLFNAYHVGDGEPPADVVEYFSFVAVHEVSHLAGGTGDYFYPADACEHLAASKPADAVQNAQNYAFFASDLAAHKATRGDPSKNDSWTRARVLAPGCAVMNGVAAAAVSDAGEVVLAYREPLAKGAGLRYKILHTREGKELDAAPFLPAGGGELKAISDPALTISGRTIHCACLAINDDPADRFYRGAQLVYMWADLNDAINRTPWRGTLLQPEVIANSSWETFGAEPGPALAAFTGGMSSGMYCVYLDAQQSLKCAAHLGRHFIPVNFDKPRTAIGSPALAMFNGQLKCAYIDQQTQRVVMLTYTPATSPPGIIDPRPGTWHEDGVQPFTTEMTTIALAQWNPDSGPKLVAVAVDANWSLHYTLWSPAGVQRTGRLVTFTSPGGVGLAACGPLYAFYRGDTGAIETIALN